MGMCMCTFVGCPIGACVGSGAAACMDMRSRKALKLAIFGAILAAGCISYVVLSILCAKADQDHWTLFRGDGECWSEGGSMPYTDLGWRTGLLMGIGFFGLALLAIRIHVNKSPPPNPNIPQTGLGAELNEDAVETFGSEQAEEGYHRIL